LPFEHHQPPGKVRIATAIENFPGDGVGKFPYGWQMTAGKFVMKITVKLFASLRKDRFAVAELECDPGQNVRDVLVSLDIVESDAAILFINSRHAEPTSILNDGDALAIFPPVGGG
jgi:sulfur carrier protein